MKQGRLKMFKRCWGCGHLLECDGAAPSDRLSLELEEFEDLFKSPVYATEPNGLNLFVK